jgi:hypothetical protein
MQELGDIHAGGPRPHGAGADRALTTRPGVPREREEQRDPGARWIEPVPQVGPDAIGRTGLAIPTPVFGTAQPARGVSGALRRAAYRIPEHRAARWMLLLAADRLDVLEHRARSAGWLVPAGAAVAIGYAVAARALARRR